MFRRILIANRGEIARRVIRTAAAMGVETVAVYSDADAGAAHVAEADHAVPIGPAPVAESYLRGNAIIEAALATGAEAIHPGYGFLSENPDFVSAVEAAGLTFIGPSADAIRAMGLKDAAKVLMAEAGVPVVPGWHGSDQAPVHLAEEAARIGYPVLIKAVAGGGGKGMRLVEAPNAFAEALASAKAEAKTAFGNSDVLIEKFITAPRHIEVQVFGDGRRAVHLYERDCSLQRRHQKVIEEAPAPGMTDEMREAMGLAAVRAAEAIGYRGAGTVEFIVDGSDGLHPDRFWFMEMNTRLQVEHPVTEAVTGLDLVEWQLRVAAGEPLPLAQDDIPLSGHAFEARIYAEDVPAGFLPATGHITHLSFSGDARADSAVRAGDDVTPWYDPMIAKLIVHGPDRPQALSRLQMALSQTEIAGIVTNIGFLRRLARHSGFARGEVETGLIARDIEQLTTEPDVTPAILAQAALLAGGLLAPADPMTGFSLWCGLTWRVTLAAGETHYEVHVLAQSPNDMDVTVGEIAVAARRIAGHWTFDGHPSARMAKGADVITVFDTALALRIIDPLLAASADATGDGDIRAPMPGLVMSVDVREGERVAAGDRLLVLEAMKMEHVLRAPSDAVVAEVRVEAGTQVDAGAVLLRLEVVDP